MLGAGFAWHPTSELMIVGDIREVFWGDAMRNFNVNFVASDAANNGPFAGQDLAATLYQDWSDQTVYMFGAAYRLSDKWTIRGGANFGDNPIPDQYLNCLFPAIVEKHVTAGVGYQINERSAINLSLSRGFENSVTSGYGVTVSHSQLNGQLMYSLQF
jgi:long-chain fatty acid transport protein